MTRPFLLSALTLWAILAPAARAIVFRSYNASNHQRFDSFPENPRINPDQLYAGLDLSGIGWYSAFPGIQFALVSRQHVVFATHFRASVAGPVRFLGPDGPVVSRTQDSATIIRDGGEDSDLILVRLAAPLDASTGIEPLPYLDLAQARDYEGLEIGVAGIRDEGGGRVFPVIGRGTIAKVETLSRNDIDYNSSETAEWFLTNRFLSFTYRQRGSGLDPDEVHFQVGDSGSPTFVPTGGRAALVGIHSYVDQDTPASAYENHDVFVPHYIAELDAVLASDGYRMRPVNAAATTLTDATTTFPAIPRRARPLEFHHTLTNSGAHETGNLEVEFHFDPAEAPDSLTPPAGWVTHGGGPSWTFRRARLAPGGDATFTASWASAPSVAVIDPGIVRRSDTTAETSPATLIPLAPSFADWAAGLVENGEDDDADHDGLVNLLEYAFGGDPENGRLLFIDGGPLTPGLTVSGGTVTLTHPERGDKQLRGLSYLHEFSGTLGDWSIDPPPGFTSTTEAYEPAVPGFVKRVLRWPFGSGARFARIRVALDE